MGSCQGAGMPHLAITWWWLLCSSWGGDCGSWQSAPNNVSIVSAGSAVLLLIKPSTNKDHRHCFRPFIGIPIKTVLMENNVLDVNMKWSEGEATEMKMYYWLKELILGEMMNKSPLQSCTWRVWGEAGNTVSNEPAATMAKSLLSPKLNFSCCASNGSH